MSSERFRTAAGFEVEASQVPLAMETALDDVYRQIDSSKGAVFSSGFDYPGRHSRWDIGFVDPALEFLAHKKEFALRALNEKGEALLQMVELLLSRHPHVATLAVNPDALHGRIAPPADFFSEEERSRQPSIFSVLRELTNAFRSSSPAAEHFGLYGAFGYDLVLEFEDIKLRHDRAAESKDCHLFLPLEVTVVDRKRETAARHSYDVMTLQGSTSTLRGGGKRFSLAAPSGTADIVSDHEPGEFAEKVRQIIKGAAAGDYFEVVLSQTFSTRFEDTPTSLFRTLAGINPSPYMFLLNLGDEQLVGASPELFVRVTGRRYETCPIAGTVPRGETALEDAARVQQLIGSLKEESELTMCTDVDRNDMARVCVPGSVRVIGRRQLEFYSHLIHTVDHVEGELRDEFDALDAFQTHMWACTVTGAPKPAALQEIENLENSPRGWYSAAIGILNFQGNLNTGIMLRTAHLRDGRISLRAGATLLYGSDPDAEELETRTKAGALLSAIAKGEKKTVREADFGDTRIHLAARKRILLVDYRDSFVHNLAAYLRELGAEVVTLREGFPEEKIDELKPDLVLLSPGPGTPSDFGVPDFVGRLAERKMPTFGVCLGHQGIGQHFGATVGVLPIPEHGKASLVTAENETFFANVGKTFEAGRYHSLYLVKDTVPDCLEVTAFTTRESEDGTVEIIPMAVRHKTLPIAGVQFHPESLMTLKQRAGHHILKNAIEILTA